MIKINGKTLALVGNAESIFTTYYGEEIDNHDIVIRFNKGYITKPKSQGTKTDILFLAIPIPHIEKFKPKCILNRRRQDVQKNGGELINRREVLDKLTPRLGGSPPSSGFAMLMWMLKLNPKLPIDLYGFDKGKTRTFYNDPNYKTFHDYHSEGEFLEQLEKQKKIRINL
jgi:hypothetical protein